VIASEYYASVLLDRSASQPLVMFSVEGGVDIEEVAEQMERIRSTDAPLVFSTLPKGHAEHIGYSFKLARQ